MISVSHWGLFEYEPNTLVWPKGFKVSCSLDEFRALVRSMGFSRVIIDKSDMS